ncbi:MAG: hypothetical protein RBS89_05460 [Candidatus Delongbacteria bacterium]|jgi:chromosome segregation ATPase|nr:hypothetical protein [Candidatus Delongbacteria bacterium]
MNDYEKLKKLLSDVRKLREDIEISVKKAGDMFELFDEMNEDCDAELEDIDAGIDELSDEISEGAKDKEKLELQIKELKGKRRLIEEAVDLFDEISGEFELISDTCTGISVGY